MRKLICIPLFFILYSCSPASQGEITSQVDPVCKRKFFLTNHSTSEKIVFTYKYTSITGDKVYTSNGEQAVGPQETFDLGCDGTADSTNFEIVGGYVTTR